ncbi:MAG: hypothetical protein MJZ81_02770 [Bacteroidales bacterium]|nr:hypothetical protein [Bacteroidales bacterium]
MKSEEIKNLFDKFEAIACEYDADEVSEKVDRKSSKVDRKVDRKLRGGLMATIKREKFMSHVEKPVNIRFIKDFIKERGVELTERQQEILLLLRENPELTSQKISQKISQINSASARTIIKDMKVLQEVGLLQRVGSKKEGHWEVIVPDDIIEVFD